MVSAVICGYCFVESDTTAIWHMLIFSNFGGTEFEMCHEHAAYFHSYCKCLPCCLILKQYCFKNIMLHGIQFRSEKRILARFKIPAFQAHEPQQWCLSRTQIMGWSTVLNVWTEWRVDWPKTSLANHVDWSCHDDLWHRNMHQQVSVWMANDCLLFVMHWRLIEMPFEQLGLSIQKHLQPF